MSWNDIEEIGTLLRCPDCLEENLEAAMAADSAGDQPVGAYSCQNCGRTILWEESTKVLEALPSSMAEGAERNRAFYDAMSADEESLLARRSETRTHSLKWKAVSDSLDLAKTKDKLILEFGTGYGSHAMRVVEEGHRYIGLDISPGFQRDASLRYPELRKNGFFIAGDGMKLPLRDNVVDGVFMVATLHHLPDPAEGVKEVMRVLKPGGKVCFAEPRRYYPTQFIQWLRHRDTEISAMKISERNIGRWLAKAGCQNYQARPLLFTPNRPAGLTPLFKTVDNVLGATQITRFLSVMMAVSARK